MDDKKKSGLLYRSVFLKVHSKVFARYYSPFINDVILPVPVTVSLCIALVQAT